MGEYILNLIRAPEGSRDTYVTKESETFLAVVKFLRTKYHVPEDNPIRLETVDESGKRIAIDPARKISDVFQKEGEHNVWWSTQKSFGAGIKSGLQKFAEDIINLVEIYREGWHYLDPKKPGLGAYRFFLCYQSGCPCKFTNNVHTIVVLPSFLYPDYPPQVMVIPRVEHLCCSSIRKKIPRKLKNTIFKNVKSDIGQVHWEPHGYWKPNTTNRLETVAIALKEEFKLF